MVMTDPANNQSAPAELKTVEKNFAPAVSPTAAKKRAMPNSRKAKFTLAGICQLSNSADAPQYQRHDEYPTR